MRSDGIVSYRFVTVTPKSWALVTDGEYSYNDCAGSLKEFHPTELALREQGKPFASIVFDAHSARIIKTSVYYPGKVQITVFFTSGLTKVGAEDAIQRQVLECEKELIEALKVVNRRKHENQASRISPEV